MKLRPGNYFARWSRKTRDFSVRIWPAVVHLVPCSSDAEGQSNRENWEVQWLTEWMIYLKTETGSKCLYHSWVGCKKKQNVVSEKAVSTRLKGRIVLGKMAGNVVCPHNYMPSKMSWHCQVSFFRVVVEALSLQILNLVLENFLKQDS